MKDTAGLVMPTEVGNGNQQSCSIPKYPHPPKVQSTNSPSQATPHFQTGASAVESRSLQLSCSRFPLIEGSVWHRCRLRIYHNPSFLRLVFHNIGKCFWHQNVCMVEMGNICGQSSQNQRIKDVPLLPIFVSSSQPAMIWNLHSHPWIEISDNILKAAKPQTVLIIVD